MEGKWTSKFNTASQGCSHVLAELLDVSQESLGTQLWRFFALRKPRKCQEQAPNKRTASDMMRYERLGPVSLSAHLDPFGHAKSFFVHYSFMRKESVYIYIYTYIYHIDGICC